MDFSQVKELEGRVGMRAGFRHGVCVVRGEGNSLFDQNGRAYVDLSVGLGENCLGYSLGNDLVAKLQSQAASLVTYSGSCYNEFTPLLCEKLLKGTGFHRACLTGGPMQSSIMAMGLVRDYVKDKGLSRRKIVTTTGVFNAANETRGNIRQTHLGDFIALKEAIKDDTAALVLQPIELENGLLIADYGYIVGAYALCKSMGVLFVVDETILGIGRTGKKFAFEDYGIQPDIVMISRGLGAGLPIGAVLARNEVAESFNQSPYGFNPNLSALSCVAADYVLDKLDQSGLDEITDKGLYLEGKLSKLKKHNFVLNIRSKGLFAAIDLSDKILAVKIAGQMEKAGFLLECASRNTLIFAPPFTITRAEIDAGCDALGKLFSETNV